VCPVCRYLGLGNEREEFFELTTPLFISNDEIFSLLVPGYGVRPQSIEELHDAANTRLELADFYEHDPDVQTNCGVDCHSD
jgi:hypothetical protein